MRCSAKRLPVVALRRILSHLVIKKRQSANKSDRPAWHLHDLLFISSYGENDHRDITFAHFGDDESGPSDLPVLRVLGWDDEDTVLHLGHAHQTLKEKLRWPGKPADVAAWRARWSSAFVLKHGYVAKTSKELSVHMAALASRIRKRVNQALAVESESGPFRKLMSAFRAALIHDLTEDDFADMYAQTITYGLLSARVSRPAGLIAENVVDMVPDTNPFLKELLTTFLKVGGRKGKIDFDELGLNDVVQALRDADMTAVLRDFNDRNPQEDPVIHFYELFLKEYDAQKRMQRGVFYTPRPVVSYIVRSVHELLQTEFGLEDGLASTVTWGEMVKSHKDLAIPDGTSPDAPFVVVLDPATGTATFLVEVIDIIHKTMVAKWKKQGHTEMFDIPKLWNEYVPKHLLPRLYGYELMMAPYAIAHMKIGLKLHETGYKFGSGERARIYLTNALEPPQDFSDTFEQMAPALAHEARAVNDVKRHQRFTVVVGNPPYANYSANLSREARRIVDKYRTFDGSPIRERNQLQFERNIQDDFVKFLSVGEDYIAFSNAGVLGYITNATMLASQSLRGLREHLIKGFAMLYELHLHGGLNEIAVGIEEDENIFDIAQAVAIHLCVRARSKGTNCVHYADLVGPRPAKYAALLKQSVSSVHWTTIVPDRENLGFLSQGDTNDARLVRLDSVFVKFGAGIKTNRDAVAIATDDNSLLDAVRAFDPQLVADRRNRDFIQTVLYRPFDARRIFYHEHVVASRSLPTMQHILAGPNIGLIACTTWTTPERFSVNVARTTVEMKTGTHDRGTTFFPLYRFDEVVGSKRERVHNLSSEFIDAWTDATRMRFLPTGSGDLRESSGPEDALRWIYGLCHSGQYRHRYKAALAQGFPIVLLSDRRPLIQAMVRLGDELMLLHLLESPLLDKPITNYAGPAEPEVEKVSYANGTVWLDKKQKIGFAGVPEAVWNFHIGGYQVCEKWLKDRKGRTLSKDDIAHYQKIVVALNETIRLMKEIDETIDKHGGWPGAFVTDPKLLEGVRKNP